MSTFDRMLEIVAACHEAGITPPMHPRIIVQLETDGYIVDLETGAVVEAPGSQPAYSGPDIEAMPTMAAWAVVDAAAHIEHVARREAARCAS